MRDAPGSDRLEQPRDAPSLLRFADFILDLDARTLVRETGEAVALTRGEFALLRVFVTRPGQSPQPGRRAGRLQSALRAVRS